MKIRFRYADRIPPFLRNKYILAIIIFLLWIIIFDANNLIDRIKQMNNLRKLKQEKEYYIKKIAEEREKLNRLRTDDGYLEKFAREQYLMKKKDEDLFIVLTPEEARKSRR